MRILFVAKISNPLAARWINQIVDQGWDVHVYATSTGDIHPSFRNVTIHGKTPRRQIPATVTYYPAWPSSRGYYRLEKHFPRLARYLPIYPPRHVAQLASKLKPDIIHTLKMQDEAYHVLAATKLLGGRLPCPWIYSVWGSDIYYYSQLENHIPRITGVLDTCDYLMADNERDVSLAIAHGFKGEVLGVFPTGGGYPTKDMQQLISSPPSMRRVIAVKGYQSENGGQVLAALEAIERCGRIFDGYRIVIHSAVDTYASQNLAEVKEKARKVSSICNVPIDFLPYGPPQEIWRLFAQARISIAISKTDGTPNTMLESMIVGAFPIQSNTGGLESWITHGDNGLLVQHDNIAQIATSIATALQSNEIVDNAARKNVSIAQQRLDIFKVRQEVIEKYNYVISNER